MIYEGVNKMNMMDNEKVYDSRYVRRLAILLSLTYGFIFIDRLALTFLLPIIAPELHLNNTNIGQINFWMTLAWDISTLFFAMLSDKIGYRKRVLVPLILLTSIFSGLTAVASSFMILLLLRMANGASEGPFAPLSATIISAESEPQHLGKNLGILFSGIGLIGLTAGPILVTQIATKTNWHTAIVLASIPSLIMGLVLLKMMREVKVIKEEKQKSSLSIYIEALKYRNVWVSVLISVFYMVALWIMNLYLPLFLTQVKHLTLNQMGIVMAGFGLGFFLWSLVIPYISDRIGRKPALIIAAFLGTSLPLVFLFYNGSWITLAILAAVCNVYQGVAPMFMNIIPIESVPSRLAATASALSVSIGELFGAATIPAIAGYLADQHGLPIVMWLVAMGTVMCGIIGFALIESSPRKRAIETIAETTVS